MVKYDYKNSMNICYIMGVIFTIIFIIGIFFPEICEKTGDCRTSSEFFIAFEILIILCVITLIILMVLQDSQRTKMTQRNKKNE